jgi:L-fuculose-phosphate aldolase
MPCAPAHLPFTDPLTGEPADRAACTEDTVRAAILSTARSMQSLGINHGSAGNLSVRWHRGGVEGLLITPSALAYERCTPDDVVWMSIAAQTAANTSERPTPVIDGVRRPSSEWRFHHDLYAARPEVQAIVHTHAPHCTALACLPVVQREGIPPFHYMVAAAGGRDIRCAPYATFGTQALSDHVLSALHERRACLMAHHGMITTGPSLQAALALAMELEWLARTYSIALTLGTPALLSDDEMERVLQRFADYRPDPIERPAVPDKATP